MENESCIVDVGEGWVWEGWVWVVSLYALNYHSPVTERLVATSTDTYLLIGIVGKVGGGVQC